MYIEFDLYSYFNGVKRQGFPHGNPCLKNHLSPKL